MATIKRLSSKGSVKNIINYVLNKEKTTERIIGGKDISFSNAVAEMNTTKELYGKKDGISYHHIIQSFKPGEITPESAHKIGIELAEKQFKNFEVLVATHKDKEHIHNHLIINSVSFKDGHKLITDKTYETTWPSPLPPSYRTVVSVSDIILNGVNGFMYFFSNLLP